MKINLEFHICYITNGGGDMFKLWKYIEELYRREVYADECLLRCAIH